MIARGWNGDSALPHGRPASQRFKRTPKRRTGDTSDKGVVSDSFLRPTFTIDQIRTFLAVAAREHITHAARVLRLSQPAVTQQVQLLERALGLRLLERVGRNVRLTSAGTEVAGSCLLIMRALENLEQVVQGLRGLERGSVTVGASEVAATYYLPSRIGHFATAHPGVSVGVVVTDSDEVCQEVAAGNLECGLIDGTYDAQPNLLAVKVAATAVHMVANPTHPMADQIQCPKELLVASQYLVWSPGSATEDLAAHWLGAHYDRLSHLFIGNLEAARRSVLQSPSFVAALPSVAVADDIRSGALISFAVPGDALPLYAVRRRGPDSPGAEALWQSLLRRRDEAAA
jgi:DNA-binding transcriptional LysR family regulator